MTPQARNVWLGIITCCGLGLAVTGFVQGNKVDKSIKSNEATISKLQKEVDHQKVEPKVIKKTIKSNSVKMTEAANKVISAQEWMMNHPNLNAKTDGGYKQMQNECENLMEAQGWNPGQVWFGFGQANMAHIKFQVESIDGTGSINCAFEVLDNKTNKLLGLIQCNYTNGAFVNARQLITQDGSNAYNNQAMQQKIAQGIKPQK